MITEKDLAALNIFLEKYPSWWYTIGVCDLSRDFTCGPQARSPEIKYAVIGNDFDDGFSSDSHGSIEDAIHTVMGLIEEATREVSK